MKWLILLALIVSCGKYSEPPAVDLKDSDGDQVQNYKESELGKYVANFERLTEVKGTVRFVNDKPFEISFSNTHDLNSHTVKMITGNEDQLKPEQYFSEWSKLSLEKNVEINFSQPQYQVKLEFVSGSAKPDEVLLVNAKSVLKLGPWKELMTLTVAGQDLKELIAGRAELVLVKNFHAKMAKDQDARKTIQEKTYRVYYNDGVQSQIYYVSNELEYDRFLELMKIDLVQDISEDFLFFNSQEDKEEKWYDREMKNGDKVIVKKSLSLLRAEFLKRFTIKTKTIGRVNGQAMEGLNFGNKENAKVYLRIKSFSKTVKTFTETDEGRGGGGGGKDGNSGGRCNIHRRIVKSEETKILPLRALEEELGTEMFSENFLNEARDEKGDYFWQMKLDTPAPNYTLKFKSHAANTYVLTGEIKSTCDYVGSTQNTHPEGKLSLELESYVEKI